MRFLSFSSAIMHVSSSASRAYNEFDDIPAHVQPLLYEALDQWGYDGTFFANECVYPLKPSSGFIMADDEG